jgi:hypothetical protein
MTATFEPPASMSHSAETDPEPDHRGFALTESGFDARRRELGVADELKDYYWHNHIDARGARNEGHKVN